MVTIFVPGFNMVFISLQPLKLFQHFCWDDAHSEVMYSYGQTPVNVMSYVEYFLGNLLNL